MNDRQMLEEAHEHLKDIIGDENGYGDPKYSESFFEKLCKYLKKPLPGEEDEN